MESEQLLLIDVIFAHGLVILQTIWAPEDKLRYGRRLTRSETIADQAQLTGRLAELVPRIFESTPPAAARQADGPAAMAADPSPAPAAGDLPAAA